MERRAISKGRIEAVAGRRLMYRFEVECLLAGLARVHLGYVRLLPTAAASVDVDERLLGTAHEI